MKSCSRGYFLDVYAMASSSWPVSVFNIVADWCVWHSSTNAARCTVTRKAASYPDALNDTSLVPWLLTSCWSSNSLMTKQKPREKKCYHLSYICNAQSYGCTLLSHQLNTNRSVLGFFMMCVQSEITMNASRDHVKLVKLDFLFDCKNNKLVTGCDMISPSIASNNCRISPWLNLNMKVEFNHCVNPPIIMLSHDRSI